MYAIVEMAGQQFKVVKDQKLYVHRLQEEEGNQVVFDKVHMIDNDGQVTLGQPTIDGAAVNVKVLKHLKGDKVIVFKKKRRKGYKKKNGHRQYLTQVVVEGIVASGAKKSSTAKKETKPAAKKEVVAKKPVAAVETKVAKEAPKKETKAKTVTAKADDLKKIEGIGPKIAQTLTTAGVDTFAKLADTKPEQISEIIAEVRGNHVTDTWPAQAKLAAEGKWEELKKWQDELDGGKA